MKLFKKIFITTTLAITLVFGMALSVSAASSGGWNIRYYPTAPSDVSNQSCIVSDINYYSGGYYAVCNSISGTNGRSLTITSSDAGGMNPVYITTTGRTPTWTMKDSTKGTVTFVVKATVGYSCESTGTIYINN